VYFAVVWETTLMVAVSAKAATANALEKANDARMAIAAARRVIAFDNWVGLFIRSGLLFRG